MTTCCPCSRKSKCFKCICSATGCTNCISPLCHFKRKTEDNEVEEPKRLRLSEVTDPTSNENRKAIIESFNEDEAKTLLTSMMERNPQLFDDVMFGGGGDDRSGAPVWCKCGLCGDMEMDKMNICCDVQNCITKTQAFKDLCLNTEIIEVAGILNYCEQFHDTPTFKKSHYRNQAYRFYVLWQHGKLGKGNRVCPPACVVKAVRCKFPSDDGIYHGYESE